MDSDIGRNLRLSTRSFGGSRNLTGMCESTCISWLHLGSRDPTGMCESGLAVWNTSCTIKNAIRSKCESGRAYAPRRGKRQLAEVNGNSQKLKASRINQKATRRIKLQFAKLMCDVELAENASGDSQKVRHTLWELRHTGCASLDSQMPTQKLYKLMLTVRYTHILTKAVTLPEGIDRLKYSTKCTKWACTCLEDIETHIWEIESY